jgi:leucyl aminopeptidase
MYTIKKCLETKDLNTQILLFSDTAHLPKKLKVLPVVMALNEHAKYVEIFDGNHRLFVVCASPQNTNWNDYEKLRKAAAEIQKKVSKEKVEQLFVQDFTSNSLQVKSFLEGLVLASYTFTKYKTDKKEEIEPTIELYSNTVSLEELQEWNNVWKAVGITRDLVNEPQNTLTAVELSMEFEKMGKDAGFSVEVWNESKIQAQKMGGLLSVNKGSLLPPTFTIMEWKPENAKNIKPIVLVGKGVVYDTGGLSLKPTPQSMDFMKCDMAGAATVGGLMYAIAACKLPLYVVGLVPATDNRPGDEAYAPGDVITMYSGHTVEVKNTDAEGRLILADALHYAKKYNPEMVFDFATLTGAAVRAIGPYASATMGTISKKQMEDIEDAAYQTFERIIHFPLWEEYAEELKSEIADFSNLGKGEGGHMSAGKFLEKFTDYPWLHVDIAGTSFVHANSGYTPFGGTGVGVRFLFEYLKKLS